MLKMTMRDQLFSFFIDSMDLRKSQVARLRRLYVDGDSIRLVAEEEGLTKQAIYLSMERFERQMSEVLEERGLMLELALSSLDGDETRYLMSSPKNGAHLEGSIAQHKSCQYIDKK